MALWVHAGRVRARVGGPPVGDLLAYVVFTRNSGERKMEVLDRSASLPSTLRHNPSGSRLSVAGRTVAACPAPHFPGSWGNSKYIFASRDHFIFVLVCDPLHLAHHPNTSGCPAPPTHNPPLSSHLQSTTEAPQSSPLSTNSPCRHSCSRSTSISPTIPRLPARVWVWWCGSHYRGRKVGM